LNIFGENVIVALNASPKKGSSTLLVVQKFGSGKYRATATRQFAAGS
jgi:hypothetical protein